MTLRKSSLTISKKLTLTYSSILLAILFLFTFVIFFFIRNAMIKDDEKTLSQNADKLKISINKAQSIDAYSLAKLNLSEDVFYTIYDKNNNIIYTTEKIKPQKVEIEKREGEPKENHKKGILYTSRLVYVNNNIYRIEVTKGFHDIAEKDSHIIELLLLTCVLGSVVCLISGYYLSKRLLKPVKQITATAKEITSKSLNKRIVTNGAKDELLDLAETINSMIERLEKDFESQKRFVSDASHELRTPLSVMHGHVNMLIRWGKDNPEVLNDSLETIKKETESMNKLIENLLILAKGDNNAFIINKESFLAVNLLKEVVDETLLTHENYNIDYSCSTDLYINGDYGSLKQLLRIIVDNSIKYSSSNSHILIMAEKAVGGVFLTLTDEGVGIPEEALPHIFDRFYRVDESRTKSTGGTGLGLAIAKQIVTCHKGTIDVSSKINEGTTFKIFIPEKAL